MADKRLQWPRTYIRGNSRPVTRCAPTSHKAVCERPSRTRFSLFFQRFIRTLVALQVVVMREHRAAAVISASPRRAADPSMTAANGLLLQPVVLPVPQCMPAKNRCPYRLFGGQQSRVRYRHFGQTRLQQARNSIGEDNKQTRLTSGRSEAEVRYSHRFPGVTGNIISRFDLPQISLLS